MADNVAEGTDIRRYGRVFSRRTTGRYKPPSQIAEDDDLIIGSLPRKMMKKVVGESSNAVRSGGKESSLEHCLDNVEGKKGVEAPFKKEEPEADCFSGEGLGNEGFSIGNSQPEVDTVQEDSKDIFTPVTQKRGADGEILRAYFLSSQRSLSRLRPRKEVPAFRMVELDESENDLVVGRRVKIYWSGSRRWFTGSITAFDKENRLHRILYEDGDKEVLDLSKERFELEVMPTDGFKLKNEPYSARKADGVVTGKGREAVMMEDTRNVTGVKTMTKSSEPKHKREVKKEGEGTSLKEHMKDTEVIVEEFGAEGTSVKSHSEFLSMGSDNSSVTESGKADEDNSLKISIADLAKELKGSKKRLMPSAKRMRANKVSSSDFGNVLEKMEADKKSQVCCDEVKATQMDGEIGNSATVVEETNLTKPERRTTEDVIATVLLNPHNIKDESEVPAARMEPAAAIKKGGKPGDVDGKNTNRGAESILKAESMKPKQEEAKPDVQGIVKLENGNSDKGSKGSLKFIIKKSGIKASKKRQRPDGASS